MLIVLLYHKDKIMNRKKRKRINKPVEEKETDL